jgi:O-antigen ligase
MRTGTIRISAPFEGKKPEPNTLAGYLLVIFGIIGGLLLHSQSPRSRFILGGLFLFIFPVFLFTLSRAGYTGFIGLYLAFLIFTKKARLLLIAVLLISLFILPLVLPLAVIERVKTTFNPSPAEALHYNALGQQFTLEDSAAQRIETWKWVIPLWQRSPFFGYGVTGVGFVDSQYTRVLGELGIIGFLVFFWVFFVLFRETLRTYRCSTDSWIKGLSLGFLASLVALLMDVIGANVFIIVRIMEPFWFIAAMVLMAPQIEEEVSPITQ